MTSPLPPPLSFDAYDADGAPRVSAGWFRLSWRDTLAEFRADPRPWAEPNGRWGDSPGYSYLSSAVEAEIFGRWQAGQYDRPLYEVRRA